MFTIDTFNLGSPLGEKSGLGLRDDNDQIAVQVYRWIDGSDLSTGIGNLPALAVAELGHRLAQALAWLHSIGVIHRDVPKNAVLSDASMRPILIDFGLARLESGNLKSSMASDFSAPEVRMTRPKWSKAADVWSLGMTLEKLLRAPDRGSELAKLLARAHADDIAARPSAEALIEEFNEVSAHLVVRQGKDEFFDARVSEPAKEDITVRYYKGLLEKFRPRFEAAHLGLLPSNAARAAEAADFLNQVVEAWFFQHRYGEGSLGSLKRANDLTASRLVCKEVDMLHQLRTGKSHGRPQMEQTIAKLKIPHGDYPKCVREGARRLGEEMGLASLVKVVNAFFA
jgi:protein kinase-like protein